MTFTAVVVADENGTIMSHAPSVVVAVVVQNALGNLQHILKLPLF
jgi:hypothetical protein